MEKGGPICDVLKLSGLVDRWDASVKERGTGADTGFWPEKWEGWKVIY